MATEERQTKIHKNKQKYITEKAYTDQHVSPPSRPPTRSYLSLQTDTPAGSPVAYRRAAVVAAAQLPVAHLLTWWTVAVTAAPPAGHTHDSELTVLRCTSPLVNTPSHQCKATTLLFDLPESDMHCACLHACRTS